MPKLVKRPSPDAATNSNGSTAKVEAAGGGFLGAVKKVFVFATVLAAVVGLVSIVVALSEREATLRTEVATLQGEINTAKVTKKSEHDELRTLKLKMLSLEKDNMNLRIVETDYEKAMTQLTVDVKKLLAENEELSKQNTKEFAALDSLRNDLVEKVRSLDTANMQLQSQTNKLTAAELQVKDLQTKKEVLSERITATADENMDLRRAIQSLQDQVKSLSEGVDETKGQAENAGAQLASVIRERDVLLKEVQESKAIIMAKEAEVTAAQSEAEGANRGRSETEVTLQQVNANLQAVRAELEQKNLKFDSLMQMKGKFEEDIQVLRDDVSAKTAEIVSLKSQIDTYVSTVDQLKGLNVKAAKETADLRSVVEEEGKKVLALQNELSNLDLERQTLTSRVAASADEIKRLTEEKEGLTKEKELLNAKLVSQDKPASD